MWLPVRDLENFRPMDLCSTECTCDTELPSCNHCCKGKAVSVTYSASVFIAVGIQYVICVPHIVICDVSGCAEFFHVLS